MTTPEILLLIQTIVLFLTGIIVLWYTIETFRIRKETSKQNSLLVQQYLIQKEKESFELKKEISFVEPIIIAKFGRPSKHESEFVNDGSLIRIISVEPIEKYSINISPKNILNTGDTGHISIPKYPEPVPTHLHFRIKYHNKLGMECMKLYKYSTKDALFVEIEKV